MRVIFLAAGSGSRLGIETNDIAKPLVDINGCSILERQIKLFRNNGITDIVVIVGDKIDQFVLDDVLLIRDNYCNFHDQMGSLLVANDKIKNDVIILFGDILFDQNILYQILSDDSDFSVGIDLNWIQSYEQRIDNPIELAGKVLIEENKIKEFSENLPIKKEGCLIGEFLGIIKLKNQSTKIFQSMMLKLEKNHKGKFHDAESFKLSKLTDYLQELIDTKIDITPIFVSGKWCEIDTPKDLEIARKKFHN